MKERLVVLARLLGSVGQVALWVAAACLVLLTAFIGWQVWGRYVLNASPNWTEPTAVLLMSWFVFLGAAVGIRDGYHMSFDVLLQILPRTLRLALETLSDLLVGGFCLGMGWYGLQLVRGTWGSTMPSIGLPGGVTYIPLVAGGVLGLIFALERVARRFAGLQTARFGETPVVEQ